MNSCYIDEIIKEETVLLSSFDYSSLKELSYSVISQGYVLPYRSGSVLGKTKGGVIDSRKFYIDQSGLHEGNGCGYDISNQNVVKKNKTAIYIGTWFPIWGHCITDNLKKIWFLQTDECRRLLASGAELVYVVIMNNRYQLPQNFKVLLHKIGVDISKLIQITDITKYDKIIIPDNSIYREKEKIFYTSFFSNTIQGIISNIYNNQGPIYKKVYFSRTKFKKGKCDIGEERIEDLFRFLGYKIIYPELLNFDEQLRILGNCTHFASTEGSISHNVMFCREGTDVCLIRKCSYVNNYQLMINQMRHLQITYVDAHLSIFADSNKPWNGPFYLYLNKNILMYARIPVLFNSFTMQTFREYVNMAYSKNKDVFYISDFYSKRLIDEQNRAYFSKIGIKRIAHMFLSRCNLFFWVPVIKSIKK